jgi:hypothetical protein
MKRTELILILLAVIALIMKIFHLPGALILSILGLPTIALFYFYLGFAFFNGIGFRKLFKKTSYKGISTQRIIGGIATGWALNASAMGILFKIQSYPGASILLWVGFIGLGFVSIFSLIKVRKSTDNYYSKILKRVIPFGAICVFLFAIPSKTWLNWNYPNNPEYVQAVLDAEANPDDEEVQDKLKEESKKRYDQYKKDR